MTEEQLAKTYTDLGLSVQNVDDEDLGERFIIVRCPVCQQNIDVENFEEHLEFIHDKHLKKI